ncbi:MAG TPA: LytTR family DNA-binding domain-containing protein, partial [Longimicrobiales bacterium]
VVVFVTAFERYAINAFDASAADYLLKPFDRARFRRTIERVRSRLGAGTPPEELRTLLAQVRAAGARPPRFVIRERGRLVFVRPEEIDRIESAGNYVRLHCGKTSHLYRETLSQLERRLDPDVFVRVHRSTIVNVERIRTVEPYFHGEYILTLADGTRLTSSRTYSGRLRELLR